jgi:hypothetical protein
LLAGKGPFHEGNTHQKLIWHQVRLPKPIRALRPEVPEALARVLERMMAKDLDRRFQVPHEVAEALGPWTQTPVPPPTDDEIPRLMPPSQLSTVRNGISATPTPVSRGSLSPVPSKAGARIEPVTPLSQIKPSSTVDYQV